MNALIEINNLTKSFGGIHAVQDLSFSVNQGEILGLIGPNGSGKSTCVNLISGIYKPDAGEIKINGRALTSHDSIDDRVRLGMGRTFQTPKPFGKMTVFDNVFTVALQNHDFMEAKEKATEILVFTNLVSQKDILSEKLPIEKRKWLDLARILVNDPKFVMMDEVMAGLNPLEMNESLELTRQIQERGVTILFIEHVLRAVIQLCSRVVVINGGRFLSEGAPQEVLRRKDVVDAYIGGGNHYA